MGALESDLRTGHILVSAGMADQQDLGLRKGLVLGDDFLDPRQGLGEQEAFIGVEDHSHQAHAMGDVLGPAHRQRARLEFGAVAVLGPENVIAVFQALPFGVLVIRGPERGIGLGFAAIEKPVHGGDFLQFPVREQGMHREAHPGKVAAFRRQLPFHRKAHLLVEDSAFRVPDRIEEPHGGLLDGLFRRGLDRGRIQEPILQGRFLLQGFIGTPCAAALEFLERLVQRSQLRSARPGAQRIELASEGFAVFVDQGALRGKGFVGPETVPGGGGGSGDSTCKLLIRTIDGTGIRPGAVIWEAKRGGAWREFAPPKNS
ncbi:MAG: hypothetical protein JF616_06550 [Fibrobacteres bacterium]|nr:hypothetical protein [Fibrobacterota bacterium]